MIKQKDFHLLNKSRWEFFGTFEVRTEMFRIYMRRGRKMRKYSDYDHFFTFLFEDNPKYVFEELDTILQNNGRNQKEGLIYYTPEVDNVVRTKAFRRTNKIFQLGTKVFINNRLTHKRGEHGKGTYTRMLDLLMNLCEDEQIKKLVEKNHYEKYLLAELMRALLHDIGHGPFSHTMETVCRLPKGFHEEIGQRLIEENAELKEALETVHPDMINLMKKVEEKNFLGLNCIFEGQFDMDRGDFLVRDLFWAEKYRDHEEMNDTVQEIIDSMKIKKVIVDEKTRLVPAFPNSQIENIQKFLKLRNESYRDVYYSDEGRAYEHIFKEFADRLLEVDEDYPIKTFLENNIGKKADEIDLDEYIKYDDVEFLKGVVQIYENTKDDRLKELAKMCVPDSKMYVPVWSLMVSREEADEYGNVPHPKEDIEFLRKIDLIKDNKNQLLKENYEIIKCHSKEDMENKIKKIKEKLGLKDVEIGEMGIICDISKNSSYKNKRGEEIYIFDEQGKMYTYDKFPGRTSEIESFEKDLIIVDKKQLERQLENKNKVMQTVRLLKETSLQGNNPR